MLNGPRSEIALVPRQHPKSLGSFVHALHSWQAAAIGFKGRSGSYGRSSGAPALLAPAAPNSLECRAFEGAKGDTVYLDHTQHVAFGKVLGRAINYGKPENAKWSDVVEGMVVLKEESPPHFVRAAYPQPAARTRN